ncbi:jg13944 [Pararge aegeria aegeria]|uniref:Jg13944 protein n=1 Tax=Pararge aegeria aegeria TaxID=348720 RepID=A0A8S4RUI1_9NEOP|nr:jg13944 [Pararge aegeria aegeria]
MSGSWGWCQSPPDVVEPWGSSHGDLSRSPHSPEDAVATPQVVIGKCPYENRGGHSAKSETLVVLTTINTKLPIVFNC